MDVQQIRDKAEEALAHVGFTVRETDDEPGQDVQPGGACLFIQQGRVRLYLTPAEPSWEAADVAARTLAGANLRVVPIGADPAVSEVRSAYVLLGGTGEIVEGYEPRLGPLGEGWRDQHQRMLRSHDRLADAASGAMSGGSDEARDRLFHFFQDAYHLKDWLKNDDDPRIPPNGEVEALFTDPQQSIPVLRLAADLCNGIKHRKLKPRASKTGDHRTRVSSQSVSVFLGSPVIAEHQWVMTSGGQEYDVIELADDIVAAWNSWLTAHNLL
ncbi:unnamed protein product [[Actinomadura] parvosata subsp. kistnae]|uniref:Uncharacterized protein n=1 Tax=[Actinomadura] parvosata subsp. kistnae TaxID=1909395 RepID=A0A1U9ZY85_9ACTN|nr:hypothetical protein [Nonomuraea sp. ATCC 55076]AQZ62915.1 hypothetical protein BKM31_16900 [Nonomuraea sp. ATCC 55076]SPL95803.1 unnamed protein product [Actinomadura parvosata subsp. kistnae]